MIAVEQVYQALQGVIDPELKRSLVELGMVRQGRLPIDPEIAHLCDGGRIEAYPAEAFGPIAQRLVDLAPLARRFG
jgi:hypothetical protein